MSGHLPHVTDPAIRRVLKCDSATLRPCFIRAAAIETMAHAESDLLDPDVHDAPKRLALAEEAAETDPVRAHGLLMRFWSI